MISSFFCLIFWQHLFACWKLFVVHSRGIETWCRCFWDHINVNDIDFEWWRHVTCTLFNTVWLSEPLQIWLTQMKYILAKRFSPLVYLFLKQIIQTQIVLCVFIRKVLRTIFILFYYIFFIAKRKKSLHFSHVRSLSEKEFPFIYLTKRRYSKQTDWRLPVANQNNGSSVHQFREFYFVLNTAAKMW